MTLYKDRQFVPIYTEKEQLFTVFEQKMLRKY